MTLDQLTALFGWMTLINIVIYSIAAGFIIFARDWIVRLQSGLMGIPPEDWPGYYIDYLSRYKLAIVVFNLAPYLALLIVG